jgi:flavin reductase (DIM6/NTAB) family NADH-FMN oxidoreductase RutF
MTETAAHDATHTPSPTGAGEHRRIWPSILYFGTPIALITTMNIDGTANIGPMSSAWALGYTVVMGWESTAHTFANLQRERECVINLPGPDLVEQVEVLAPLTGRNPPAPHKADTFRYEPHKFQAAGLRAVAAETVKPPRIAQ